MITSEQLTRLRCVVDDAAALGGAAIRTYGQEAQLDMMIEECAELMQAICHMRRGRKCDVAGELADVIIVAVQVAQIAGVDATIDGIANKTRRLRERIRARKETTT